jgi:hypothetical protein
MIANDNQVFHNTKGILVDSNQVIDLLKHNQSLKNQFLKAKQAISGNKNHKCGLYRKNSYYHNTCSK